MQAIPVLKSTLLKKDVAQIYNRINQEMFGLGVKRQKIELMDNMIMIFGEHQRAKPLHALQSRNEALTLWVDASLVAEFKQRLKHQMENLLKKEVISVLKDYDPKTEKAVTIIYLREENC